jgi:hypothetical protein
MVEARNRYTGLLKKKVNGRYYVGHKDIVGRIILHSMLYKYFKCELDPTESADKYVIGNLLIV